MNEIFDEPITGELPIAEPIVVDDAPDLEPELEDFDNGQASIVNELNEPKDPMGITVEPDDDALRAKDLLDDDQFKFTGEMITFGIDVGAAWLLAFIAHQQSDQYRLNPKDLKKLEKVVTKCAKDTKVSMSPWQGLIVSLAVIYGTKIPEVLAARREWENQPKPITDEPTTQDKGVPVGTRPDNATDPTPDTDEPTTPSAGEPATAAMGAAAYIADADE